MKTKLRFLSLFAFLAINSPNVLAGVTIPNFSVTCATKGTQLCEPAVSASIATTADWQLLQFKYDQTAGHCSSVRLHVYVDGVLVKTTGALGWSNAPAPFNTLPLTTGIIALQSVRTGIHVVSVKAEGQVGGCNSGSVSSWGGTIQLLP